MSLFLGCCPSTSPSLVLVLATSYGEKQLWRGHEDSVLSRCAHSGAGHAAWFGAFGLHVLGLEKTCMLVNSGYGEKDSVLAHGETSMEFLALPGQRVSAAKPCVAKYLHGIFFSVSWLRDVLPAYPVSRIFPILERKTQLIRCCPCFLDLAGELVLDFQEIHVISREQNIASRAQVMERNEKEKVVPFPQDISRDAKSSFISLLEIVSKDCGLLGHFKVKMVSSPSIILSFGLAKTQKY